MILLTAMVGAIVLTLRHRPGVKRQDVAKQNARTPANAVTITRPAVGAGVDTNVGVGSERIGQ
jgi:NADH-quinone oxidoreductase subunit J